MRIIYCIHVQNPDISITMFSSVQTVNMHSMFKKKLQKMPESGSNNLFFFKLTHLKDKWMDPVLPAEVDD